MLEPVANYQAPSVNNWGNIVDSFLDSRSDRIGTTLRDLKTRMRRVLETIAANPKPRDGRTLMKRFAEMHFDNCAAGGQGRKNVDLLMEKVIEADKSGDFDSQQPHVARHLRAISKEAR